MRGPAAALVVLLLWTAAAEARPEAGFKNGIALAEIHPGHDGRSFAEALGDIKSLGASWTLIPVYGFTDSAAAPGINLDYQPDATLEEVRNFTAGVIAEAHRQNLSVLLIPYVNLRQESATEWRGSLRPPDWNAWFLSYETFILGWADFCRNSGVEMMAVGAELISTEHHTEAWRAIIGSVRRHYPGAVTYSCNWDHYRAVAFHQDLDVVGLSGYYSLPYDAPLTAEAVELNWREVKAELVQYSHEIDRRLLFTEIGYPSVRGASRDPWNYQMIGEPDPGEQARALAAFFNVWSGTLELDGVFVWNYSPFREGHLDTSYSINGKPAAAVVRTWFLQRGMSGSKRDGRRP